MSIYHHTDYRDLISSELQSSWGRGSKVKLAETLACNPAYISQVLSKTKIHFSPENIIKIGSFLGLSVKESEFLLSLHHMERAGSKELKDFWEKKVQQERKENSKVEKQIKAISQDLSELTKATYYSHWAYSAIHMLVSIDQFKDHEEIAKHLRISKILAGKVISFLEEHQLIIKSQKYYEIGKTRIHLKPNSPLIRSHHQNFRNKAIQSLEEDNDFDLHYSAVLTLSKKDAQKIKQLILKMIADKEEILLPSENEEMIGLNLDLFKF